MPETSKTMTMGFAFERLGVACATVLECVDEVLKYKPGQKYLWRLQHLRREVYAFKCTVFPGGTGEERKGDRNE